MSDLSRIDQNGVATTTTAKRNGRLSKKVVDVVRPDESVINADIQATALEMIGEIAAEHRQIIEGTEAAIATIQAASAQHLVNVRNNAAIQTLTAAQGLTKSLGKGELFRGAANSAATDFVASLAIPAE